MCVNTVLIIPEGEECVTCEQAQLTMWTESGIASTDAILSPTLSSRPTVMKVKANKHEVKIMVNLEMTICLLFIFLSPWLGIFIKLISTQFWFIVFSQWLIADY